MTAASRQTIALLVNDSPGVLQRIAGLLSRRGYNMDSLTVGASEREGLTRIVIVTSGDDDRVRQMCSQLVKLIDVREACPLAERPVVSRELMLVKLRAAADARADIRALADTFRCSIVDVGADSVIVQVVGDASKNDAFVQLVRKYGILELNRTGETAMYRG